VAGGGNDSSTVATDNSTYTYSGDSAADFESIVPVVEEKKEEKKTTTKKTAAIVTPPAPKTNEEYCTDMNGPYGTYNASDNSCGCAAGYYYGVTSKQCVSLVTSRDESCSAKYSNTSFLKYDTDGKTNICDCKAGYDWNNDRTACFTPASFSQSCKTSYGEGSYSSPSSTDGKRYCDCSYGYDWDIGQKSCVTTASINQICERDVGRNSRYSGTITDGKYNCTQPY